MMSNIRFSGPMFIRFSILFFNYKKLNIMKQTITILIAVFLLIMTQLQLKAQTNYRVYAQTQMYYDGSQFVRTNDSFRTYFNGSHSYADLYGEDLPQFTLFMEGYEHRVPTFPENFTPINIYDSTISYEVNSAETAYEDATSKRIGTVDSNGNISEIIFVQIGGGGNFTNWLKESFTYNSAGQITEFILQEWQLNTWQNDRREISVYNAAQKLEEFTKERWSNGSWIRSLNYINEYDVAGNCTQTINRDFNGSSWDNKYRTKISYDANHHVISILSDEWIGGIWQPEEKATMTYNSNGDLLSRLTQDYIAGVWKNTDRETFNFSGNKKTESFQESFDGSVWNKVVKTNYSYASSGLLEYLTVQFWDNPISDWLDDYRLGIGYNSNNLISFIYSENWIPAGNWQKDKKYNFFYESYEGENTRLTNLVKEETVHIYPNPTSTILNVVIDWQTPQSSTMAVYDITGRVFILQNLEKAQHSDTQIDVSRLPAGTYFLKISNTQGQWSKAFQVVK